MIECVPNFSEGIDPRVVEQIVHAIAGVSGVIVLGWESDADHNRSVVTFVGDENLAVEGAVRGAGKAAELIDLSRHRGVHPRVGAADVIPFIPLAGSTIEECVSAAHRAGEEIWKRYGIPVYFYEAAARDARRKRLERVRRAEFDGRPPDIGDIASHPTAGASVIGARQFLIAYNVDLMTPHVEIAQQIARAIRESSGGFRHVKAMGIYLHSRGCAQVSMNLTNFVKTPLEQVYDAIGEEAERLGTSIRSCELIGFVPQRAVETDYEFFRRAENFDESRIIETRIATIKASAGHHRI